MTRVVFLGSKRVGLRCLETMVRSAPGSVVAALTLDDATDVRTVHGEFLELSRVTGLPVHTVSRRSDVRPLLKQYAPALCIVVGWYWLIPEELLAEVPGGFVGIHFSLLPLYRGSSPLVWAMINGERETGVSMFSLVKDVDAGDLWGQRHVSIGPDEYIGTVLSRLEDEASELIREVFPRMLRGEVRPVPQHHSRATFCSPRSPEHGLIDWNWPAERVLRFIRAQSRPYPGAFTHAAGEKITIWRASPAIPTSGAPGDVVHVDHQALVICGDGAAIGVDEGEYRSKTGPLVRLLDESTTRLGDAREIP